MDVFEVRQSLIDDYANYIGSFFQIKDARIDNKVKTSLEEGLLWPEPLIQLNPSFEPGKWIDELVKEGVLAAECGKIFRKKPNQDTDNGPLRLHKHQEEALRAARTGANYVLTTGTGSGKSLAYIVPIVDHIVRNGTGKGVQAIVIYPMNALANSQEGELKKFLHNGYPNGKSPVTFRRYTGQENDEQKNEIIANPPDIILTNYVMLELMLTRPSEAKLIAAAKGMKFLVFDELHTYRGRQGADVALLARRVADRVGGDRLQFVGTSATLAGGDNYEEKQREVATVASKIFGSEVRPENVIGETLRRATPELDFTKNSVIADLASRVSDENYKLPTDYESFVSEPLSSWLETTFGIKKEPTSERLMRTTPLSISGEEGAAKQLSNLTGVRDTVCAQAIQRGLLAGYQCEPNPETGFPAFAFRVHQFISRGDTVHSSLESAETRYLTMFGQQFAPEDRTKILLPMCFCRECGQEYYSIRLKKNPKPGERSVEPRIFRDQGHDEIGDAGYLYFSETDEWPDDDPTDRIPDEWLEEGKHGTRIKSGRKEQLPKAIMLDAGGFESAGGLKYHFVKAPFQFCLSCGVAYSRSRSDFGKLSTLSSEGRSTATTILNLSAILRLRTEETLPSTARKLLSFTDNRQDASLQAGHFNDFVEIGLLRGALYRAVDQAGSAGISHEVLCQKVFDSMELPVRFYSLDPTVRFQAKIDTDKAFRDLLGYRIYRDLERGWRITAPNLEQCGLLEIEYLSLKDVTEAEDVWQDTHSVLLNAPPVLRMELCKVLLDHMRRALAIQVDYLDPQFQERIQRESNARLRAPWSIDENERMLRSSILYPRSSRGGQDGDVSVYLSPRGAVAQFFKKRLQTVLRGHKLDTNDVQEICRQLLNALKVAGLVAVVREPRDNDDVPGYQLRSSGMLWKVGEGKKAYHDPIRVPRPAESGGKPNSFFVDFYQETAKDLVGLEGREHTAQVDAGARLDRESRFRQGELPILFCSPTMELGVDIADLNVVNLRNMPPTPANYSQRSGRAGRSGQPALVFTYCSSTSQHDQYFYRRPEQMVAGVVTPPRLELANEDLVRAHIHSIWLAETKQDLKRSLKEILDLGGQKPPLSLLDSVIDSLKSEAAKRNASARASNVLRSIENEIKTSDWYTDQWLESVLKQALERFDQSCERWRSLFRAASNQRDMQHAIVVDHLRNQYDKDVAKRLRREAESQIDLLLDTSNVSQSDFYSYRYFASEGFLPGYSFPRLPLSAFIPARKKHDGRDEFLSRPRFLAISEFGPRSIIYHEGARYVVNKVILPATDDDGNLPLRNVKQCERCSYIHPVTDGVGDDLCNQCGASLPLARPRMFRLENVVTRRRDRISSDEEERVRQGYELKTGFRFAEHSGRPSNRIATLQFEGEDIGSMTYGDSATLWRINIGWARRRDKHDVGFVLDVERGIWEKDQNQAANDDDDNSDPLGTRTSKVVPFVEDRRNCLIFRLNQKLDEVQVASLQSALKSAIQVTYQLEDSELASEPLPDREQAHALLFYEAAEGGAGVLRRLLDNAEEFANVAKKALELCHFDPETLEDLDKHPRAKERCEAACYDCLMSYRNQKDHLFLDRGQIRDLLGTLRSCQVNAAPAQLTREEHLQQLMRLTDSELEREWLRHCDLHGYRLPSHAQKFIEKCGAKPDFFYEEALAAVYIDGPIHDYPDRQARDDEKRAALRNEGYAVLRFKHSENWQEGFASKVSVFGKAKKIIKVDDISEDLDKDLFPEQLHKLIELLQNAGVHKIEPGSDVMHEGMVIGRYHMEIANGGDLAKILLIDANDPDKEKVLQALKDNGTVILEVIPGEEDKLVKEVVNSLGGGK